MFKRIITLLLVLICVFSFSMALSSCGKKDVEEPPVEVPDEPVIEKKEPETPKAPEAPKDTEQTVTEPQPVVDTTIYSAITGLEREDDISASRPYAVMINNISDALPLHGVSDADIIFETLAEGGITRLLAVFEDFDEDEDEAIGSIRSARHYFLDLLLPLDAVFIHAGGSPQAYNNIYSLGVDNIDGVNGDRFDIFYRDSYRMDYLGFEHSLVSSGELIDEYLPTYDIRLEHEKGFKNGLVFADDIKMKSEGTAEYVEVNYSYKYTDFIYDSEDGLYYAEQYGDIMRDGNNDDQVAVKNVIVLMTDIYQIAGDDAGRVEVDLTSGGDGYYFCDGKYASIHWEKEDSHSPFVLTYSDGTQVQFARGKSYFCIIPDYESVEIDQ